MTTAIDQCELCTQDGGEVLYRTGNLRVVLVDDASYPGFCRVIWHVHVKEMTDLPAQDRDQFMQVVWKVESALREVMQPRKMNVASLGNMVPHLHWHLIPRFEDDAHFPAPIWADVRRSPDPAIVAARGTLLPALRAAILRACTQ